jgi:hypothetical protein
MTSRLMQLTEHPASAMTDWREIISEINSEFPQATSVDQRVALLAMFKATMDIAEKIIVPEDLATFREARAKHYAAFIVGETLVGTNVCVETLNEVTQREVAAGRMQPDAQLRQNAILAMAAPHLSRQELIAIAAKGPIDPIEAKVEADAKERALDALDASAYFGLNWFESLVYRLMRLFMYRREDRYAREVLEQMQGLLPLDRFSRGKLLGMLDAWYRAGDMSMHMHCLLQVKIQDKKYWAADEK